MIIRPKDIDIGGIFCNSKGQQAEVLEYGGCRNVRIRFLETGYETITESGCLRDGRFRDYLARSVCGVGYLGDGAVTKVNGKIVRSYDTWSSMLNRCYAPKSHIKRPTYEECSVSEEWHSFTVFDKWYQENYPKNKESECKYHLDKDLILRGNKIYGAETCVFVPYYLNSLTLDRRNDRGILPIGVTLHGDGTGRYQASYNDRGKGVYVGLFSTPQEAFLAYKYAKEAHVKEVALESLNKGHITTEVYEALLKFEVVDDTKANN